MNAPRLANAVQHLHEAFAALANAASAIHDASIPDFDSPAELAQPTTLLTLLEQARRPLREAAGIIALIETREPTHVAAFGQEAIRG